MNEQEIAQAAATLPDRFAGRISATSLAPIREYAEVGEWGEELELLVATLHADGVAVTAAERDLLNRLADAINLPGDLLDQLPRLGRSED